MTGSRLYRLQYSDDLQIPQAEIDFKEFVAFLLDRGDVPDIKGLRMLRVSGLWTPTGTSHLLSPDTLNKILKVSMPNDSDGVLIWNARGIRGTLVTSIARLDASSASGGSQRDKR